ncbi:MAG: alpha-amylase family glycosyl hydrolase, partial [Bacteroidota bacterium]
MTQVNEFLKLFPSAIGLVGSKHERRIVSPAFIAVEFIHRHQLDGNESWGYNPAFFFAPDKYYGPSATLKEFIDTCHRRGIAVILDMVLNHTTGANPLAALYWNAALNQPAANNPWLNETARHPFNVFNDFNHESLATRYFSCRVMEHWLKEY